MDFEVDVGEGGDRRAEGMLEMEGTESDVVTRVVLGIGGYSIVILCV
jgi:hypothetical protein